MLKFEPTILCDIRSWDYITFQPGLHGIQPRADDHGAPALGGRNLLQVRNSVQEADAAGGPTCAGGRAKPVQARQPLRGVQAAPGSGGRG